MFWTPITGKRSYHRGGARQGPKQNNMRIIREGVSHELGNRFPGLRQNLWLTFLKMAREVAEVLLAPEVAHALWARSAKVGPLQSHTGFIVPAIKQADGLRAVLQVFGSHVERTVLRDAPSLLAQGILAHDEHLVVGEQAEREVRGFCEKAPVAY